MFLETARVIDDMKGANVQAFIISDDRFPRAVAFPGAVSEVLGSPVSSRMAGGSMIRKLMRLLRRNPSAASRGHHNVSVKVPYVQGIHKECARECYARGARLPRG